jgi:hypothetical protein
MTNVTKKPSDDHKNKNPQRGNLERNHGEIREKERGECGGEVAQSLHTRVSKCKDNKIK